MRQLTKEELTIVSGGKIHFNIYVTVFSAVAATIMGGPAAGGAILAAAIASQGAGNLGDMYQEAGFKPQYNTDYGISWQHDFFW